MRPPWSRTPKPTESQKVICWTQTPVSAGVGDFSKLKKVFVRVRCPEPVICLSLPRNMIFGTLKFFVGDGVQRVSFGSDSLHVNLLEDDMISPLQ
jgi:hypothetical protein